MKILRYLFWAVVFIASFCFHAGLASFRAAYNDANRFVPLNQ